MPAVVGVRILAPAPESHLAGRTRRRPAIVIPAGAVIGLFTGMLADGGGFLLVPPEGLHRGRFHARNARWPRWGVGGTEAPYLDRDSQPRRSACRNHRRRLVRGCGHLIVMEGLR